MNSKNALELMIPWSEVKEKIKETNSELTDDDLDFIPGKEDVMLAHLSQKMNRSVEAIKAWIESISSNKGKAS